MPNLSILQLSLPIYWRISPFWLGWARLIPFEAAIVRGCSGSMIPDTNQGGNIAILSEGNGQRWSYLPVVLDLFARRVVGWAMSSSLNPD
jgi:hypothetical protein